MRNLSAWYREFLTSIRLVRGHCPLPHEAARKSSSESATVSRWRSLRDIGSALVAGTLWMYATGWCAVMQHEPTKPKPEAAQVLTLLRAGKYEAAHQAIQNLLRSRSQNCELNSFDGLALNGRKQVAAAGRAFHQALKSCPNDLLALEGAAQADYATKSPDAAELLQRVLVLRPDDVTAHAMLASLDRGNQDCNAALRHYKASQKLFTSSPKLQEGFAYCLMATGNAAEAAANYRAVLDLHPSDTVRYNLAVVLWKMHNTDAARQVLQPLLSTQASEDALELGEQLAEEAGDTPEAVQLLRDAILRSPKNQDNYLRFAQISFAHNSCQVGIDMLNAGLQQLPNAARLYLARGVLEVQLSENDQAIADFERAHRLEPQLSLAMDAIGILQSQQHRYDSSLLLFQHEARQHPGDSLLQYLYAEALSDSQSGRETLSRAIKAAEQSVKIDPSYQPAHDLLAKLYLRAGDLKRAIDEAVSAERIDPTDELALYQEMMATRQLGDTKQERKLAQRFAELRKENAQHQRQGNGFVLRDDISH